MTAETLTKMWDSCNPVKEKFPELSVVVDVPVSGPLMTDTVAPESGIEAEPGGKWPRTLPWSENVVAAGAVGEDDVAVPLAPQAMSNDEAPAISRYRMHMTAPSPVGYGSCVRDPLKIRQIFS